MRPAHNLPFPRLGLEQVALLVVKPLDAAQRKEPFDNVRVIG